jgi:hypothetical protein
MPGENPDKLNDETLGCMEPVVRETWHRCAPAGIINVSICKPSVGGILSSCFPRVFAAFKIAAQRPNMTLLQLKCYPVPTNCTNSLTLFILLLIFGYLTNF